MDQAPERNIKDAHFLKVFSITVGSILAILTLYIFGSLMQLLSSI